MASRDQGRFITGETSDVRGIPGEYAKNYETKYDWRSTYQQSGGVTGIFGAPNTSLATGSFLANDYGAWVIETPQTYEGWNAGPTHPQTPVADGASIIPSPPGSHFGGPSMVMTGNQDQTYGPIFNYFNKGSNIGTLRGDADKYAAANATGTYDLNSFYDSLSLPYYATAAQRGIVSGNIRIADGQSMTGATVILSTFDPAAYATSPISQEYQRRAKGYNYWISANPDGTFSIPDVRPGTYRVTVIKPGNYREGTYDNITVTGGATTNVGRLTWQPDVGNGAWQIGTFDRTADEFRDGENHNNWIDTFNRSVEFPNGVNYTVNPSKPLNDPQNWKNNWVLDQSNAGFDFWKVNFNLPAAPAANSTITLTLAVADQMFINDIGVLIGNNRVDANFDHTADNAPGVFRSGETSSAVLYRKLTIPASWLAAGNNTFSFHIVGGDMQWDALRLDIQNPGTFSMSQWDGGNGNWSDATHWATQKYNFTGVNKGQATINGVANPEYGNDTSTTFADGATNTAPINNGGSQLYYDAVLNGGVLTLDTSPTVQKLSLLNGTLSVGTANTVTANDAFVFAGGNVSGTGSINALSTTTINFDNTISSGFKVISTGAVTWNDGASVTITDPGSQWTTPGLSVGSGALNVGAGATFSVGAGSLNVGTLATVSSAGNVVGASITNTGTFAGTGSVTLSGAFNNSGTASISGRLSTTGVINNAGLLILSGQNVYTGATTISGGAVQFAGASSIGGSGQSVTVNSGGAVSFAPGITDPTFLAASIPHPPAHLRSPAPTPARRWISQATVSRPSQTWASARSARSTSPATTRPRTTSIVWAAAVEHSTSRRSFPPAASLSATPARPAPSRLTMPTAITVRPRSAAASSPSRL